MSFEVVMKRQWSLLNMSLSDDGDVKVCGGENRYEDQTKHEKRNIFVKGNEGKKVMQMTVMVKMQR